MIYNKIDNIYWKWFYKLSHWRSSPYSTLFQDSSMFLHLMEVLSRLLDSRTSQWQDLNCYGHLVCLEQIKYSKVWYTHLFCSIYGPLIIWHPFYSVGLLWNQFGVGSYHILWEESFRQLLQMLLVNTDLFLSLVLQQ